METNFPVDSSMCFFSTGPSLLWHLGTTSSPFCRASVEPFNGSTCPCMLGWIPFTLPFWPPFTISCNLHSPNETWTAESAVFVGALIELDNLGCLPSCDNCCSCLSACSEITAAGNLTLTECPYPPCLPTSSDLIPACKTFFACKICLACWTWRAVFAGGLVNLAGGSNLKNMGPWRWSCASVKCISLPVILNSLVWWMEGCIM